MAITTTDTALLRLLQLASPALPVGAYAFSQGLEYAMEGGWVKDGAAVKAWLSLQLEHSITKVDVPILLHLYAAWESGNETDAAYWNDYVLACRETSEIRLAELATGEALARLLPAFDMAVPTCLAPPAFISLFTLAAREWGLSPEMSAYGYVWSWLENQVTAATKLLPMGQTQAQVLLSELHETLPPLITSACENLDPQPGSGLPGVALASCKHETQYSRLFRS